MKLSKAQRAKTISTDLRETIKGLSDDQMLAVHDLTHQEMERRWGSPVRSKAPASPRPLQDRDANRG